MDHRAVYSASEQVLSVDCSQFEIGEKVIVCEKMWKFGEMHVGKNLRKSGSNGRGKWYDTFLIFIADQVMLFFS
jgi:hypothetical protein